MQLVAMQRLVEVAPLAGAWIEICLQDARRPVGNVAPLAGAWIEIKGEELSSNQSKVAPLAGAWIEISLVYRSYAAAGSRSPRGSVD